MKAKQFSDAVKTKKMKNYATMVGNKCFVVSAKSKADAAKKLNVSMSAIYLY